MLLQDLSAGVTSRSGLPKKDSESVVRAFFDIIQQYLIEDKIVKVKGLGTFKMVEVSGRDSVDVNTGERIHIKGHSKITFTPDAAIRNHVNRPFADFETVILNEGVDKAAMEYTGETESVNVSDADQIDGYDTDDVQESVDVLETDVQELLPPVFEEDIELPVDEVFDPTWRKDVTSDDEEDSTLRIGEDSENDEDSTLRPEPADNMSVTSYSDLNKVPILNDYIEEIPSDGMAEERTIRFADESTGPQDRIPLMPSEPVYEELLPEHIIESNNEPAVEELPKVNEELSADEMPSSEEKTTVDETALREGCAEDESAVEEPTAEEEPIVQEPVSEEESTAEEVEPITQEFASEDESAVEEPAAEEELAIEEPIQPEDAEDVDIPVEEEDSQTIESVAEVSEVDETVEEDNVPVVPSYEAISNMPSFGVASDLVKASELSETEPENEQPIADELPPVDDQPDETSDELLAIAEEDKAVDDESQVEDDERQVDDDESKPADADEQLQPINEDTHVIAENSDVQCEEENDTISEQIIEEHQIAAGDTPDDSTIDVVGQSDDIANEMEVESAEDRKEALSGKFKRPRYELQHTASSDDCKAAVSAVGSRLFSHIRRLAILLLVAGLGYWAGSRHMLGGDCPKASETVVNPVNPDDHGFPEKSINDDEETDEDELASEEQQNPNFGNDDAKESDDQTVQKPSDKPVTDAAKSAPEETKKQGKPQPDVDESSKYPQVKGGEYLIVGVKEIHLIRSGESVNALARKYFGNMDMGVYISTLNKLVNPNLIEVGQELKIPVLKKK